MSQENVEIVRAALETTSIHDVDAMLERLDPEVRFDLSERVFNPGMYEGHDGFRRFVQEIDEVWEDFRIEPLEFIDAGEDKVVVSYLVRGRGKGSGVDVALPSTSVYTLRDGKLIEARMYREHGKPSKPPGCGSSCGTWGRPPRRRCGPDVGSPRAVRLREEPCAASAAI